MSEHDVSQGFTPTIEGALSSAQPVQTPVATPVSVDPASISTPGVDQTRAAVDTSFQKQQAIANTTVTQALDASVKNWDTARIANAFLNKPDFKVDPQFNKTKALSQVDFPVDEDSRKFLFEATSSDDFNWRVKQLQDMQKRNELASTHPVLNAVVQFADPLYLAADLLNAGAASALKLGRLAGGVAGAAGTVGILRAAGQERPVSNLELFGAAAMHGAATLISTRPRVRSTDESGVHFEEPVPPNVAAGDSPPPVDTPSQAQTAFRTTAPEGSIHTDATELVDTVLKHAGSELTEANRTLAAAMGAHLRGGRAVPAYIAPVKGAPSGSSAANLFHDGSTLLEINNPASGTLDDTVRGMAPRQRMVILHEVAHATTQRALHAFQQGVQLPPQIHKAVANLQGLREEANAAWQRASAARTSMTPEEREFARQVEYGLKSNDEFISQMFNSPEFREFLSSLPSSQKQGAYRRAVKSLVTLVTGKTNETTQLDDLVNTYAKMLENPQLTRFSYGRNSLPDADIDSVPKTIHSAAAKAVSQGAAGVQSQVNRPWAEWSLFKRIQGYGPEGAALASRLLDDPLSKTGTSAASIFRETHARFDELLTRYDNTMQQGLREQGWGFIHRLKDPVGYRRAQQAFEQQVREEIDYRTVNPAFRGTEERVSQAVDRLGEYSRAVGHELERTGMVDKGFVDNNPYYYPRRMSVAKLEDIEKRLAGHNDLAVGQKILRRGLAESVQKATGTDRGTSRAIAYAMIERARRKGYGIDNSGHILNEEGRHELLELINSNPDIQDVVKMRARQLLVPAQDAERVPMLKSRVPLDMLHEIQPGIQVRDLFDDSIASLMDNYNHRISGRMALHEVGLGDPADRERLVANLAKGIKEGPARRAAVADAENIFKYFLGEPVGEEMSQGLRAASTLAQATGLAAAGLWQIVEYGTLMQRFGAARVFTSALRALPDMRSLMQRMRASTVEGRQLALDVEEALTAQVTNEIRMRPVMNHYEDMFTADKSPWMMRLEQARDATMFINMQKYIHYHQVRTMTAIVVQDLRKAAAGDVKAIQAMRRYGANDDLLRRMQTEFNTHGNKLDNWDENTFIQSRRVLMNAMDDGIVRARIGELPAFMEFSTLGKFLFTFRRFVAATHNKTLVNTVHNESALGMATLMAYQYPLAMMATAANNVISGQGFDAKNPAGVLAGQALNYVGALGFASEFFGVLSGQQRSFGAPGLLFVDRVYGLAGSAASTAKHAVQGDGEKTKHDLQNMTGNALMAIPLLSIVPGVRALSHAVKDD